MGWNSWGEDYCPHFHPRCILQWQLHRSALRYWISSPKKKTCIWGAFLFFCFPYSIASFSHLSKKNVNYTKKIPRGIRLPYFIEKKNISTENLQFIGRAIKKHTKQQSEKIAKRGISLLRVVKRRDPWDHYQGFQNSQQIDDEGWGGYVRGRS